VIVKPARMKIATKVKKIKYKIYMNPQEPEKLHNDKELDDDRFLLSTELLTDFEFQVVYKGKIIKMMTRCLEQII